MSFLLTNNSTPVTMTGAGQIALGNAVHGCGRFIILNNNAISINGSGYYKIMATVNASITAATAATVSLLVDGQVVNSATITPAEATGSVEFVLPWIIRKECACKTSNITLTIDAGATINDVTVSVEGGHI